MTVEERCKKHDYGSGASRAPCKWVTEREDVDDLKTHRSNRNSTVC